VIDEYLGFELFEFPFI